MISFNMKLDPYIVAALDAERKATPPRCSRVAFIEAILYERYKETVERLRAQASEQAEGAQTDTHEKQTLGATN